LVNPVEYQDVINHSMATVSAILIALRLDEQEQDQYEEYYEEEEEEEEEGFYIPYVMVPLFTPHPFN